MIWTCTTSTESALATMSDLLTVLGATASSCGMDKALADATAWAERHILNGPGVMRRQVYAETVAAYGTQRLRLGRFPVLAIQRMFDSTDTGNATEYCSTDHRIENPDAGFVEMRSNATFAPTMGWSNYMGDYPRPADVSRPWFVVYEAGWQLACTSSTGTDWATTTTGRTLPEDVERAVLLKAADLYQWSISGASRIKVGPLELNYRSADDAVDPVVELLAPWRRL